LSYGRNSGLIVWSSAGRCGTLLDDRRPAQALRHAAGRRASSPLCPFGNATKCRICRPVLTLSPQEAFVTIIRR